jgi:DNA-binding protein
LIIHGRAKAITKAITVAEIVKRKMDVPLDQQTEIYTAQTQDDWDPVDKELDR